MPLKTLQTAAALSHIQSPSQAASHSVSRCSDEDSRVISVRMQPTACRGRKRVAAHPSLTGGSLTRGVVISPTGRNSIWSLDSTLHTKLKFSHQLRNCSLIETQTIISSLGEQSTRSLFALSCLNVPLLPVRNGSLCCLSSAVTSLLR